MHGVDTDIIVRCLTGDNPQQADKVRAVIGQKPVFVPRTVLQEVSGCCAASTTCRRSGSSQRFVPSLGVSVEDAGLVAKAMDWAEAGMDFADALHLAAAAECEGFLTFDKRFARFETRLSGIKITAP